VGEPADGVTFIDVTYPQNPVEVGFVQGPMTKPGGFGLRDIKTYGHYAYVMTGVDDDANTFPEGLQIIDLTRLSLTNPVIDQSDLKTTWTSSNPNFTFGHNMFIDEVEGRLYLVGGDVGQLCDHDDDPGTPDKPCGILMLNIKDDPENPVVVDEYLGQSFHDLYMAPFSPYLFACAAGSQTIEIFDVSTNAFINLLTVDYPTDQYPADPSIAHTPHSIAVSEDGRCMITSDEGIGGDIIFWNIWDFSNIHITDRYDAKFDAVIHNIFIKGNYCYISHYSNGLVVLDITDPYNVVEVAAYDTYSPHNGTGFVGAWGVYPHLPSCNIIVSDMQTGLYTMKLGANSPLCIESVDADCTNDNGIATVIVNTTPSDYQWDDPDNQFNECATGLAAGTYNVTATSNFECVINTASVTIDANQSNILYDFPQGVNITSNTTWNGKNYKINDFIAVKENSTLTINSSTIEFGPEGRIIVFPGSILNLQNTTLTTPADCDVLWKGIWSLISIGTAGTIGQIIADNSVIENAEIGINLSPFFFPTTQVCINDHGITITNTLFKNNQTAIRINSQRPPNNPCGNLGGTVIVNCQFILDDNAPSAINHPVTFIDAVVTTGIFIISTDFMNNSSVTGSQRPIGILSNGATRLSVYNGSYFYNLSTGIQSGDAFLLCYNNIFNQLQSGIKRFNPPSGQSLISYNLIDNVNQGIFIQGGSFDEINNNTFNIPSSINAYGLFMVGSDAFHIEGNTLTGANVPSDQSYGMIFDNCAPGSGVVFDNDISSTDFHLQFQGRNEKLKIRCNNFNNPGTKSWTVLFDDALTDPFTGCDEDHEQAAGNHWLDLCTGSSEADIFVSSAFFGQVDFMYFHHLADKDGLLTVKPECSTPSWKTTYLYECKEPEQGLPDPSCADPFQGKVGDPDDDLQAYIAGIKDRIGDIRTEIAQSESLIDGGDTQAIINAFQQNVQPGILKNLLMQYSPYLSDIVLKGIVQHSPFTKPAPSFPAGIIKDVIIANSPVTEEVMNVIDQRQPPLPKGVMNAVNAAQTGISERELLERSIIYLQDEILLLQNEIIRQLLKREFFAVAKLELDSFATVESDKALAEMELANGNLMESNTIVDSLMQDSAAMLSMENQEFCKLMKCLIDNANMGRSIYRVKDTTLQMDSAHKEIVREVAYSNPKRASNKARAVLEVGEKEQFVHPIMKIQQNQNKLSGGDNSTLEDDNFIKEPEELREYEADELTEGLKLENYPNPFVDATVIAVYLPGENKEVSELIIHDIIGNTALEYSLKNGHNFINISSEMLGNGVYFYSVIRNGAKVATKKMIKIE